MKIEIQKAGPDDLALLMQWRMEVLHAVFCIPADQPLQELEQANRAYYQSALPNGEHIACFARAGGQIIGCGGVCFYREMPSPDNPGGRCAYLMNIYTRPAFRGQGAGGETVAWLIRQARARRITKITLETSDQARPLYEKMGFCRMDGYLTLPPKP